MDLVNTLYTFTAVNVVNFFDNYCQKILRLCVFQHAENAGSFERTVIRIYKFFTQGICSYGYDPDRAKIGTDILKQLGGEEVTLRAGDKLIDTMQFCPETLEKKIQFLGGRWERRTLSDGQNVFAICPPEIPSKEWVVLETNLLHLKWPKKEGVIITCPSADLIKDDKSYLFIQVNSASTSYVMMQKRIGFFLGFKQKVCVFDPPGTGLSTGKATEGAFYETIQAVFEKYAADYAHENVWAGGACLGCLSAAYLKSQVPGINLLLENGFVNMQDDMVKPEGDLVFWFVKRYWGALFRNSKEESGFNIDKMWASLPNLYLGRVLVVSVDNDQRLSPAVAAHLVKIAQRISKTVEHIHYQSPNKDTHFTRIDDMPKIARKVTGYIFD